MSVYLLCYGGGRGGCGVDPQSLLRPNILRCVVIITEDQLDHFFELSMSVYLCVGVEGPTMLFEVEYTLCYYY